jgi:hypothetical protein
MALKGYGFSHAVRTRLASGVAEYGYDTFSA